MSIPHSATVNAPGDLAGRVAWHVGGPHAGLRNERPDLVPRLAVGRPASALPALLSALLSMCGHAHQLASTLAIAAARGQSRACTPDEARALQIETVREHLRRLWIDWPRLWPGPGDAGLAQLKELHGCPILQGPLSGMCAQADEALPATQGWLDTHVFGMPAAVWLGHWQQDGEAFVGDWCHRTDTWPAAWLSEVAPMARNLAAPVHALWPDDADALTALAQRLATQPGHAHQPAWAHQQPETGPWCRLHDRPELSARATPARSAWWRMASRLADLARLALPDDDGHTAHGIGPTGRFALQQGTLSLGSHQGLAWVEMARGTLIHWVQLDGDGAQASVRACQVVAPTEWNFHVCGPVAQLLDHLGHDVVSADEGDDAHLAEQAALVVAAWDPCVPFAIVHEDSEPHHA